MGCSGCRFLDTKKKKEGKVNGAVYFCSKQKKFINGANDACDSYKVDPFRKAYERDEIYKDGKKFYDDDRPLSSYIFILIIIILLAIILKIFGY